jgi:O-antigen/teichoic acid export membrane protein
LLGNKDTLIRYGKIFASYILVQTIIQIINAVCGFVLIRALAKDYYAWFTVASGVSAMVTHLGDSGISTVMTSIGGSIWQDHRKLSSLIESGMRLRRTLSLIAVIVISPFSVYLLRKNGCDLQTTVLLTLLSTLPVWQFSTSAILMTVNRLHGRRKEILQLELLLSACRITLILGLIYFEVITVISAIAINVFSQFLMNYCLKKQVADWLHPLPAEDCGIYDSELKQSIKRLYPNSLFTCVQSQLSLGLISLFSGVTQVADFGAINRFGILFNILLSPMTQWIQPAFSKASTSRQIYKVAFCAVAFALVSCCFIVIPAVFLPQLYLLLLGDKYKGLNEELFWVLLMMSAVFCMQTIWGLNMVRSWVRSLSWNIPLVLLTQITLLFCITLDTIRGVALFGIVVACAQIVHASLIFFSNASQFKKLANPI